MNHDIVRNRFFSREIAHVLTTSKSTKIFEVGPGASAVLTKMVLSIPNTMVCAVEAVHSSVVSSRRCLREFGDRYECFEGLVGDAAPLSWYRRRFQTLLLETMGHIASCEGLVAIVQKCAAYQFLSSVDCVIPRFVETWAVPVDLSNHKVRMECLGSSFSLIHKFPFPSTQISDTHALVERYDLLNILRNPHSTFSQTHETKWTFAKGQKMDGIALYIRFRGESRTPWTGSFEGSCSNWLNVFFPMEAGPGSVQLKCECNVDKTYFPEYKFTLLTGNYSRVVCFGARDLLGDIYSCNCGSENVPCDCYDGTET